MLSFVIERRPQGYPNISLCQNVFYPSNLLQCWKTPYNSNSSAAYYSPCRTLYLTLACKTLSLFSQIHGEPSCFFLLSSLLVGLSKHLWNRNTEICLFHLVQHWNIQHNVALLLVWFFFLSFFCFKNNKALTRAGKKLSLTILIGKKRFSMEKSLFNLLA